MSGWLYSIVGVVFLGVLLDILYPNGKTNAFCRSIFGIFAVIMMIMPILNIGDIDETLGSGYVDEKLEEEIKESKDEAYEIKIIKALEQKEIIGLDVEITSKMTDSEYVIENIDINCANLVLNKNISHTNKYEVILREISKIISLEEEKIFIYG